MIPKIIHYCWFGGKPLPDLAKKCIASWKQYFPDYEIKEWNESNFDVNIIPYTSEAYKAKKYAFVSDYARFFVLYKYGGLYFDTDVEVIRNMDAIISKGPFMGCESQAASGATPAKLGVAPGLGLGVNPGLGLYGEILDYYKNLHYCMQNGKFTGETVVTIISDFLSRKGLKNTSEIQYVDGVYIYPQEYFCPLHEENNRRGLFITNNTYTIHWWAASWQPRSKECLAKLKCKLMDVFGDKLVLALIKYLRLRKIRKMFNL